jgi:hypothetical protein
MKASPKLRGTLRVMAIALALWAADRYMLNGQITDASIRTSHRDAVIAVEIRI